jgi:hypothetical protein
MHSSKTLLAAILFLTIGYINCEEAEYHERGEDWTGTCHTVSWQL